MADQQQANFVPSTNLLPDETPASGSKTRLSKQFAFTQAQQALRACGHCKFNPSQILIFSNTGRTIIIVVRFARPGSYTYVLFAFSCRLTNQPTDRRRTVVLGIICECGLSGGSSTFQQPTADMPLLYREGWG